MTATTSVSATRCRCGADRSREVAKVAKGSADLLPMQRQPSRCEACCRRLQPMALSRMTQVTLAAPCTSTCVMP